MYRFDADLGAFPGVHETRESQEELSADDWVCHVIVLAALVRVQVED
jgi:hypothetical protein